MGASRNRTGTGWHGDIVRREGDGEVRVDCGIEDAWGSR